ncbi:unnamed protein product, partial [Bubo scandiacus]
MYLRRPGSVQQVQRSTDRGRGDIAAARGNQQQENEEEEEAQLLWLGCSPVKPKRTRAMGCCSCRAGGTLKDHPCCS